MQNPTTYCNPISLTQGSERVITSGEPVIKIFNGDYYLFVRRLHGYWWSPDFVNWTYVDAPEFLGGIPGVVEIDGKLYNYAGNTENRVRATDDPKTGIWYDVGTFSSNNYGDASMLYDEETGRLFMYYGWSQLLGIRVVEIDKTTFKEIGEPVVCIWGDPYNHGWETRYAKDNIFPLFDHREYRPQEYGWTEGGHPLKYNGKYYLMYASIGLEFYSYGHGVYVADDPMGPYVYDEHNPFTLKTTGVAPGAGHGSIFVDKQDNVWCVAMLPYALNGGSGNTLMALYPAGVDAEGVMHGKTEFGDYPQYLPGVVENPTEDNFTKWLLLSLDKEVEASSTLENYWTAHAVDEDPKSYWSAETGDPGEYITVDLGTVCDIRGIQILWDRSADITPGRDPLDRYQSYTVEVSDDNQNWTMIIDKSNNTQDLRTDYTELPAPVYGRYVRLTNVFTPDDGKFAVKAFRAFGNPEEATWTKVDNVMAVRDKLDRRYAHLVWEQVDGADGYIVRYGIEPDKLYNSYMVYWDSYLDIPSLNVDPEYYFEVEAFSSNTPRYVENTFETRGRGAELDLIKEGDEEAGTESSTERVMTYETYGTDEVYVFDDITPGTYSLRHTFGVGIWGPVELTEDELIGTGTEPTVTALNLTQFGVGSTQWGTIEVRVYPGETSGRIEVTFKYDK
ncbi:MAG: discoidin domain-containing protein [Eubacteriales bacterium]|nr:discoidin domain-containing protein [Eubacteriales bacterium]